MCFWMIHIQIPSVISLKLSRDNAFFFFGRLIWISPIPFDHCDITISLEDILLGKVLNCVFVYNKEGQWTLEFPILSYVFKKLDANTWKYLTIFDDFSKFRGTYLDALHLEKSSKYGKNLATNEEKPCSTWSL